MTSPRGEESHEFQAEVAKLLHLMVHSVYSEKEVFLRELISNASDACDKLRYEAITHPDLTKGDEDFRVEIRIDKEARTLTLCDNGIGMSHDELIDNLGTIARSGTSQFMAEAAQDKDKAVSLIGQFGVGFYSAFMIAERVDVTSRRAGSDEIWHWSSEGTGAFTLAPVEKTDLL
ncbi:MAG: molecular chaperone HtpG, partial [Alphaproteobacteria bacterium]